MRLLDRLFGKRTRAAAVLTPGKAASVPSSRVGTTRSLDSTVSDTRTGLMWQQSDDGQERTYSEALSYCRALRLAGHSDWRLPSLRELQSTVVAGMPANVDRRFVNAKRERYWTRTEFQGQPDIAYTVDFADGGETSYFKVYKYYVRAVRG